MASTTSERLQLLLEHVRLTLAERKRKPPVGGEADARSDFEISRSLDTLQQGINQLEKEQRQLEEAGDLYTIRQTARRACDAYTICIGRRTLCENERTS